MSKLDHDPNLPELAKLRKIYLHITGATDAAGAISTSEDEQLHHLPIKMRRFSVDNLPPLIPINRQVSPKKLDNFIQKNTI